MKELNEDTILSICTDGRPLEEVEKDLFALGATLSDEDIDDGCDDGEDEYVMKRLYTLSTFDIRLYYGNNTRTISYQTITDNN